MTRRQFIATAAGAVAAVPAKAETPLIVPVHQVTDKRAEFTPEQLQDFSSNLWSEAVRDFGGCGIELQTSEGVGEIRRSPAGRPLFEGLERGAINVVLTDYVPLHWDSGRGLAGVSTQYEGRHLCLLALNHAHGHRIPFVSVNTCVHELLHVLLQDIFVSPEGWWPRAEREVLIDWHATRLWLFHDGGAVREAARAYLERLRAAAGT